MNFKPESVFFSATMDQPSHKNSSSYLFLYAKRASKFVSAPFKNSPGKFFGFKMKGKKNMYHFFPLLLLFFLDGVIMCRFVYYLTRAIRRREISRLNLDLDLIGHPLAISRRFLCFSCEKHSEKLTILYHPFTLRSFFFFFFFFFLFLYLPKIIFLQFNKY